MSSNTIMASRLRSLSPEQVSFYREQGYLVVREVFSPAVIESLGLEGDRLARERADLIDPCNMRVRFKPNVNGGLPLFEVFDPMADLSPVAKAVAHDPTLLAMLQDLYGEPACLFKDKLIYKPAGAAGATLHQDWIAWPGFPESFVTVLVAIDPFTEANGATEVYPGLHQQGYLSPKDGQHHVLSVESMPCTPVPLLLDPGDIAIFGCFTPHVSSENRSSVNRRGYFISYNALSDGGDQYEKHYREYHAWIRNRVAESSRDQLFFK